MSDERARQLLTALVVAVAATALMTSCDDELTAETERRCRDAGDFADYVSPLLERRCGSTACSG